MKIIHALKEFPGTPVPVFLAMGCFDGLHIGHRAVIQVAIARARACGGEAWVFTFNPHPAKVLDPEHAPPLIFTPEQQLRHLQKIGIDGCILQPFTTKFTQQEPSVFFDSLCTNLPELAGIFVGEDWSFGKNRSGTPPLLTRLCREKNIFFSAHPPVCWNDERVSSTRIRNAIQLGHLNNAQSMLSQPISTIGTVVHGRQIGRRLGYPTANIEPENEILPPRGIYAAQLRIGHRLHNAAAYIGHRGTFIENAPQILEVHLIDEKEIDLYGQQVEVHYLQYIRGDRIFDHADQLKEQIKIDLTAIRSALS